MEKRAQRQLWTRRRQRCERIANALRWQCDGNATEHMLLGNATEHIPLYLYLYLYPKMLTKGAVSIYGVLGC
jgi:hypothetical protein